MKNKISVQAVAISDLILSKHVYNFVELCRGWLAVVSDDPHLESIITPK